MELTVDIDDAELKRKLAFLASREMALVINQHIGETVLERTKDHLDQMSVSRHKVADRLGAPHSKYFEYASGRMAGSPRGQTTELEEVNANGATIAIKNTPGLARAFHDMHITAKRARALTIPLDRVSHGKRVADLRREGHEIFRPKGTNILAETKGSGKNKGLRPLYALVQSVTIPKDEGLLPTRDNIRDWAEEAAESVLEVAEFGG